MILKRRKFALQDGRCITKGTTRCTPVLKEGEKGKRGAKCEACNLISGKKSITSKLTGRSYTTPTGNCRTSTLIYAAECLLCEAQYVGKTDTKLQKRISGHRGHVNKKPEKKKKKNDKFQKEDEGALAEHMRKEHGLTTVDQFNCTFVFTILQVEPRDLDECEQTWVSKLETMHPYGLNIEKPRGVADSVMTMFRAGSSQ